MGLKINLDNRTEFVPNLIATSKVQLDCQDPVATTPGSVFVYRCISLPLKTRPPKPVAKSLVTWVDEYGTGSDRDCVKTQPHSNPGRGGGKAPFPHSRLSYLSDYTMVLGAKHCRKCCVRSFQVFAQLDQV